MSITPLGDSSGALALFGIQAGPDTGQEVPVRSPVVQIGSGSQNDIVISDDSVSATHARLEFADNTWRLTDLRSTNGTYIDGVRLSADVPTVLDYGSTVRLGAVPLDFHEVEAADPAAAREDYAPPSERERVADRRTGLRLPVWLVVLILLLIVVVVLIFGGIFTPTPEPVTPATVLAFSPVLPGVP